LVLLAAGCGAPSALADPARRISPVTCARRPGYTLRRAGDVRIYKHDGQEYGCVRGGRRTVPITGRIEQVAGL
jgi:hypothetical protein